MNAYLQKALKERFELYTQRADYTGSKSIIDCSIQAYLNDVSDPTDPQKKSSIDADSKELIVGQIKLFIFTGHDTTSASVCYSFYLLSQSPSDLHRIRAEHDEVFGTKLDRASTMISQEPHILNRLPFTLAVIKETLRLFPTVSSPRLGEPDFSITAEDGRAYPTEGCLVWSVAHTIHRSPDFWPFPDTFLPERWLVPPGHELYPTKGAWRPFEYGPRTCIGQELALLEMKVALVLTARSFQFTMPYDEWDRRHSRNGPKHVAGERAYQCANGGPSEGMPCRVKLREA